MCVPPNCQHCAASLAQTITVQSIGSTTARSVYIRASKPRAIGKSYISIVENHIMETDNSLQCHLIKEVKVNCYKLLNVSISPIYGFALFQYNNYNIKALRTTVLEKPKDGDSDELDEFENKDRNVQEIIGLFRKLNCEGRLLAEAMTDSYVSFYDACAVMNNALMPKKQRRKIRRLHMIKLSALSHTISMLEWNPKNPAMLAAVTPETLYTVLFDFELELSYILAQKDMTTSITAISWNPTGTQLTVGDAEGRIYQFNPQLHLIRFVCPPRLIPSVFPDKFACSGICWVSKTERIVVFTSETSDKLHLTKLTVKPHKLPKWTVWDVLPTADGTRYTKTFNFLPVFEWNVVFLSSPCLSEVFTFGVVNNAWQPLKLDERFTIKAPLKNDSNAIFHNAASSSASYFQTSKNTFITSMSINYSAKQTVNTDPLSQTLPPPVVYVTTSDNKLLLYHVVSLNSDRTSLFKPAKAIEKEMVKYGPKAPDGASSSSSDWDDDEDDSDDS